MTWASLRNTFKALGLLATSGLRIFAATGCPSNMALQTKAKEPAPTCLPSLRRLASSLEVLLLPVSDTRALLRLPPCGVSGGPPGMPPREGERDDGAKLPASLSLLGSIGSYGTPIFPSQLLSTAVLLAH